MSIGSTASSATTPFIRRITAEELGGLKKTPTLEPNRVERLFNSIDAIDESTTTKRKDDASGLKYYEASEARLENFISNLPNGVSIKERNSWDNELSDAKQSVSYYKKQISSYQNMNNDTFHREAIFKTIAGGLGKTIDEVKQMYLTRFDKTA